MLKVNRLGEVVQLMMGREMEGTVLYWTAAYLVDGLLIDTGCAYTVEELGGFLEKQEVELVVNSHHHEDHIGANAFIKQQLGLEIYAHPLAIPLIKNGFPLLEYQEMVWGYPELTEVQPLPETIRTKHYSFEVIETPGHSLDHIVLFEREKGWCFSGDLFVSENLKVLRADEDINGIIASLEKLMALPAEELTLYTSLGRVVPDGKRAMASFLEYLRDLRQKVAGLAGESLTAPEIRDHIFGRETQMAPLTGGHFSVLNLVEQLMPKE